MLRNFQGDGVAKFSVGGVERFSRGLRNFRGAINFRVEVENFLGGVWNFLGEVEIFSGEFEIFSGGLEMS